MRYFLKTHTFCAASCSSLWAITLCLAALELSFTPELTGGEGLDSAVDASFSLPRFFLSGMRSGALAKRATPGEKRVIRTNCWARTMGCMLCRGWLINLTDVGVFESSNIICAVTAHQGHITQPL